MVPILDPGVPLSAPPFQYHLRSQLGSSRCARRGLYCLSPFPPFDWRLWWDVPVLPAMKRLFLSLLGSLLGFLLVISVGRDLLFLCSLLALLFFVNDLRSSISPSSRLRPLFSGTLSTHSNLMGRGRKGVFGRAREKGSGQDRSGIDGAQVCKALEDGTKRRCKDAICLWLRYVLYPCSLYRFPPPLPHLRSAPQAKLAPAV
jgi:hypothetical protein